MAVCKTCGKKYSKWTTPVSAEGLCADCFQNVEPEEGPGVETEKATPPVEPEPEYGNRHGCLTAWLVLMIIANAATALTTPFMSDAILRTAPGASPATIALITGAAVANVLFAIALFRWKKWGFFGFVASSFVALGTNLYVGLGIAPSLLGLVGIAVLYWVLHIGGSNQAWRRLQ